MPITKKPRRNKPTESEIEDFIDEPARRGPNDGEGEGDSSTGQVVNLDRPGQSGAKQEEPKVPLNFTVRESVKERFIEGKYRTRKKMVEILEEGLALWEEKNL